MVVPSNAYDAKGLMIQAIRDDDPVMFFEHKALYPRKAEVPEEAYTLAFGEANILREGDDATVVAIGRMVTFAEKALDGLAARGHQVRPDRPAHHLAAGCEGHPRQRREHRAADRGR